MKALFTFCLLLFCGVCFGQSPNDSSFLGNNINFDRVQTNHLPFSTTYQTAFWRDTISNPNNIWQIGKPQKRTINNAVSAPNVLITDTVRSYPVNDTSSFVVTTQRTYAVSASIAAYYKVASDSLKDFGYIEVSVDSGKSWINLMTDTIYNSYYRWIDPKPVFTGHSGTWKRFWVQLGGLVRRYGRNDFIDLYTRFTFVSDNNLDTLDGLAFDNFSTFNNYEGIPQIQSNSLLSLYPNPVIDLLYVERKGALSKGQLQIMDGTGRLLFEDRNFTAPSISTKALGLPAGLYFARFTSGEAYAVQKFLVAP